MSMYSSSLVDCLSGDSPEVRPRFFAEFPLSAANGLRVTARGFVILSAAKDLSQACVQQTQLTSPWGLLGNHKCLCLEIPGNCNTIQRIEVVLRAGDSP